MPRALVYIVPIALAIYALIELSRSEPVERAGLHPLAWVAIILFLPVVGPVIWILLSRSRRRAAGGPAAAPGSRRGRSGPAAPRAPLAPDDDPDFLWRLERDRRRAARPGPDVAGGPVGSGGPAGPEAEADGGTAASDGGPSGDPEAPGAAADDGTGTPRP